MPSHVLYPKVSLERATGKIARWMVAEGDKVRQGQILFEIEDDKAAVEVEAPADGVIGQMTEADHEVDVGDPVALIFAPGETPVEKRPELPTATARPTPKPVAAQPAGCLSSFQQTKKFFLSQSAG